MTQPNDQAAIDAAAAAVAEAAPKEAAPAPAAVEKTPEPPPAAPALDPAIAAAIEALYDKAQGRAQEHYGRKFDEFVRGLSEGTLKELKEAVNANNARVTGLVDIITNARTEADLAQMSDAERADHYKKQNEELRKPRPAPAAQGQQVQPDPRLLDLTATARAALDAAGLTTVSVQDVRLWEGYSLDLPYDQKIAAVRRAVSKLAGTPAPSTPAAPKTVATPPSTRGTPSAASQTVNNPSDLADLFTSGKITREAYRAGKADIASKGRAVVPL